MNKGFLPKTVCILLSGKAGVGKTYWSKVLDGLLLENDYKVTKESFATGVKDTARFMGWEGRKDDAGRRLLQDIGRAGRLFDIDMWVKSTFRRLDESVGYPYDVVIIDDCRFRNEIDYIKKKQHLYKVVPIRINAPSREALINTDAYMDESEVDLDNFDFTYRVDNNLGKDNVKTLDELKNILELEGLSF